MLLVAVVAGLAPAGGAAAPDDSTQAELQIPRPDLSSMTEAARRRIETLQKTLEELLAEEDAGGPPVVEAFGLLGQFFHAFQLLDAAEVCYSNALRLVPGDPRWSYLRGLVESARGRLEEAAADFEAAVEAQPEVVPFRIRLGNTLLQLGRPEEARQHFQEVLEADPESAAALYGLGRVAAAGGDPQAAVYHFERALALQPEAGVIHVPLAQAYRRLGKTALARRHLEERGEGQVGFPDRLASSLTRIAKSIALEVVADLAAEEDFSEGDFLGFVLSQLGEVPGAAEQLQQMLAHLEGSGQVSRVQQGRIRYAVGALLVAEGQDPAAVEELSLAVELAPGLRDARLKLGNVLARLGRLAEAVAHYDRLLAMQPGNTAALRKRAAAWENLGQRAPARADLEKVIALEPENTEALVALAELELRDRDYRDATRHYQMALEADPGHTGALGRLAGLLGQLGRYGEAAEAYRRLVDLQPHNTAARLGEATALILLGEHAAVRRRLEEGLEVLPQSLDLKDVLARHLAASPDRSVRDGARAVALAREVYQAVASPESVETLAMAHAEAGQFDKAIEWQEKLITEAEGADEASLERWRRNLALYERGEACCGE